ncbi:family 43 glycosylhydrolase [Maribellus comscasis]|uniref:Family 43 glycosylhydrolase n=1 Tax=Maribellus comscasis TaxID=2681766 RepID=A0A6I6JXD8_9BACT|nr:family 43 glycosylhydrolase [Maribellus comscasis]QGY44802.1 family 43 glycosylhydrolase [Maribellus comscasis]
MTKHSVISELKKIKPTLLIFFAAAILNWSCVQKKYTPPERGNPLLPGYFADPTIKKFGDTYYLYATTDGIKLASGEPQVWISKDFVNWYNYEMDIELPEGLTNCWAPDVVEGRDGHYYYFMGNCQFGCNIYGYVSDSPMGPWKPIHDGEAVVPVGTSKEHLPALDAQFFNDDNGDLYSYFGTWCTSFGGMGWAKFNPDNFAITKEGFIPIEQIPEAFEAAYMIKRDSTYFLMYSAGDCRLGSYSVHYAWSNSPEGPFVYGKNNPLLVSNEDGTIDGPGHHSILKEGDDYYILYHRHDNPHSTGGEFRQVCVDKLYFSGSHTIEKITPTHSGIGYMGKSSVSARDLATGASVSASSYYHLKSMATRYTDAPVDFEYLPEYAVDDNNGTMWKAASAKLPQTLTIDLGKTKKIERIATQFEYPTFYYQYKIEVSVDGTNWKLFADKTANKRSGSPMIDDNQAKCRFVKLTVTGTEKSGMFPAIWNIKVYNNRFEIPSFQNKEVMDEGNTESTNSLLVDLNAEALPQGKLDGNLLNSGTLEGEFLSEGNPEVKEIQKVKGFYFDGKSFLKLDKKAPKSLDWNSSFTASTWVYNPEIGLGECLVAWNTRKNMLQSSYAALMYGKGNFGAMAHGDGAVDLPYKNIPGKGQWHHILVTFDGMLESVYVDGKLDTQIPISLFVKADEILIGTSGEPSENFTGYMSRVQLYDKAFSEDEIHAVLKETKPLGIKQE